MSENNLDDLIARSFIEKDVIINEQKIQIENWKDLYISQKEIIEGYKTLLEECNG